MTKPTLEPLSHTALSPIVQTATTLSPNTGYRSKKKHPFGHPTNESLSYSRYLLDSSN